MKTVLWQQALQKQGRTVSDEFSYILDKMLRWRIEERYQSAAEVLMALQSLSPAQKEQSTVQVSIDPFSSVPPTRHPLSLIPTLVVAPKIPDEATNNLNPEIERHNRALELNPEYAYAYNNRGNAYRNIKEYDKAIADYNRALELNPQHLGAYIYRGVAYCMLKEYDKAIADYNRAIELNPEYAYAYNNRGNAYRNIKEYDKAIADYNRAIEINAQYAFAYNNRGNTYRNLKEYDKAIADYNRALEINPQYAAAYNNRELARELARELVRESAYAEQKKAHKPANFLARILGL